MATPVSDYLESPKKHPKDKSSSICDYLYRVHSLIEQGNLITSYGHRHRLKRMVLRWKEEERVTYQAETNCYGFVSKVLSETYPKAYAEICFAMAAMAPETPMSFDGIPTPFHYAKAIEMYDLPSWKEVRSIELCEPGDILVYYPPTYSLRQEPGDNKQKTGTHVMFVNSYEGLERGGYHHIRLTDCTRVPHSRKYDSRWIGKGSKGGIGSSSVFIKPSSDNSDTSPRVTLRWSFSSKYKHDKVLYILRAIKKVIF